MSESADTSSAKPKSSRADALTVLKRLRDNGQVAYFAGGCVRDMLLGIEPKDYDVATDAPPEKVRRLFSNTQAVGAAFGVILVRLGGSQIEVATFRADLNYTDGRHPEGVRFTTAEEDAKRRDFTINGLFFDPIENKVIDYVGGQEDLKDRILRAIGEPNHRFEEDHLRMLRAVRFAARFDLKIDPGTRDAIVQHAAQLARISPERIAEELRLMLTPQTRISAWRMLHELDLDRVVFRFLKLNWEPPYPEVIANRPPVLIDRVATGERIEFGFALAIVVLEYLLQRLPHLGDWERALNEVTIRSVSQSIRQALKISNDESDMLEQTLYGLERLLRGWGNSIATAKRFLARPTARYSREIFDALRVDDETSHAAVEGQLNELQQTEYAPVPLVSGDDLVAAGLKPGRLFKRVLDDVYDAQLEDRVSTKDEAMRLAMEIAKS
jgi:poly(A) polymerase